MVGKAIQQAVTQGAILTYCCPSGDVRSMASNSICTNWGEDWVDFREKVLQRTSQNLVDHGIHKLECDFVGLVPPDHAYLLFICRNPIGVEPKAFGIVPTETVNDLFLPMSKQFTSVLLDFLVHVLQENSELPQDVRTAIML